MKTRAYCELANIISNKTSLRATKCSIESTYSDLPCYLKVNRDKLPLINRPWMCKTEKIDYHLLFIHETSWTWQFHRDRKIRTALRTNQIARFVTVPSWKKINRGYYMVARRYEFYVLVARTMSREFAALTREILFLPREHKIHIFELTCNVLFIV